MKLGFCYSVLNKTSKGYESFGPFVRYVEEFLNHFDEVVLFSPVFDNPTPYTGTFMTQDNVRVVELPPISNHIQAVPYYWEIRKTVGKYISDVDVIIAAHVIPFSEIYFQLGQRTNTSTLYYIGIDPFESVEKLQRYKGIKNVVKKFFAKQYLDYFHRTTNPCIYLVNGEMMASRLRSFHARIRIVHSSVMRKKDFFKREDTCRGETVNLLSVSYLDVRKDIPVLLKALRILLNKRRNIKLSIIGEGPIRDELESLSSDLALDDALCLPGALRLGDDLNQAYINADIFVFTSLVEGNPRVIKEAMAHSLPVITTPCGSVTDHIKNQDTGMLIPFRDPQALADAVEMYIDNPELRRQCIANGFNEVQDMSVEDYIKTMSDIAKEEYDKNFQYRQKLAYKN